MNKILLVIDRGEVVEISEADLQTGIGKLLLAFLDKKVFFSELKKLRKFQERNQQ